MKYGNIKKLNKYLNKYFIAAALFVCYMIALLTIQNHVLFYQEQHSLFMWTVDYFRNTVWSTGFISYLGSFIIQFYHIPWLGAAIVSLMAVAVYFFTESIIERLSGKRDLAQVGVLLAVALYFTLDRIDEKPGILVITFAILGALSCVLFFLKKKSIDKAPLTPVQIMVPLLLVAVYLFAGLQIEMHGFDRRERAMIRAERAVKQRDWDGVLQITEKYLSTGATNRLMLYLRNTALAQKGELIDRMFDFPQKIGQQSLAFSWNRDSRDVEYGHWVHEFTGDVNAAHQWAFEAMTVTGETAPHLIDLARYNVALGRPKVAEKFAKQLDKTLFYRGEAESIRRQIAGKEAPAVRNAMPDSVEIKWINVLDFRPNVLQNSLADSTNTFARQYLLASMLLNGDLVHLIPLLRKEDLNHRIIKEAVLIYSFDPKVTPLSEFGLAVDDETGLDFSPFYKALRSGMSQMLEDYYGKSYWYYLHCLKPNIRQSQPKS